MAEPNPPAGDNGATGAAAAPPSNNRAPSPPSPALEANHATSSAPTAAPEQEPSSPSSEHSPKAPSGRSTPAPAAEWHSASSIRSRRSNGAQSDDPVSAPTTVAVASTADPSREPVAPPPQAAPSLRLQPRSNAGSVHKKLTHLESCKNIFRETHWVLKLLLLCIPASWALAIAKEHGGAHNIPDLAVFITAFFAIIPLAGLLGFATEQLAERVGETWGGLLNATLGNVVELIVAILALVKCELGVVQSSLIGSILSNILLVLGACYLLGGYYFSEQSMLNGPAQLNMSMLLTSVFALMIPSAFHFAINTEASKDPGANSTTLVSASERHKLLSMSHGVAVILLVIYIGYTIFTLWTHRHWGQKQEGRKSLSTRHPEDIRNGPKKLLKKLGEKSKKGEKGDGGDGPGVASGLAAVAGLAHATALGTAVRPDAGAVEAQADNDDDEVEDGEIKMTLAVTLACMLGVTALVGVTAEFLVSSISGVVKKYPSLSAEFVGLILLPIVGNAAEHFSAVMFAKRDKLDGAIAVAVGSSIQIATFVVPVIQIVAWCIGKPMTLLFDPFQISVLFLSVLIANQTMADGRANWMEGFILSLIYLIVAVAMW